MDTKADLVEDIARIVQDKSYDEELILRFLNRARNRIAGRVFIPVLRSSAIISTVPGKYAVPMPDEYQHELFRCYDNTTSKVVTNYPSLNLLLRDYPYDEGKVGSLFGVTVQPTSPQVSIGTITLAGLPVADETFVIGTQTFIFKAVRSGAGEVTIGADAGETAINIVAAMGLDITDHTGVVSGDTVIVSSVAMNAAANATVFSTAATNMTMDGIGFMGGTQLGVLTAWLRYLRSPSEAHALKLDYFAFPIALVEDADIPYELPDNLANDLIVQESVYRIFTEIYSEDKPQIAAIWKGLAEESKKELELFLGPYARVSVPISDAMDWDEL
jgi:hypothetical protein